MVAAELIDRSATLGTIEVGKLADIVALDKSPLGNITELEHVRAVMKDGALAYLRELTP